MDSAQVSGEARHHRCLLCASPRLSALNGYSDAHLVRCNDCSMVFSERIATDAELHNHYRGYGHEWHDSALTRRRYAELLDTFEPYRSTNRILDFGCGAGFFLEEAQARGWEAHGCEYPGRPLELGRSKGLNVVEAPIDQDAFPEGFFDVITSFEVFEHVRDPHAEAATLACALRPQGLLYCTTPNFNALSRRLLGPRWSVISYPEHLCYFTRKTLRFWLETHGFTVQSIRTTGISPARVCHGASRGRSAASPGAGDEQVRQAIEGSRALRTAKAAANAGLSIMGLGDTLKAQMSLAAHPSRLAPARPSGGRQPPPHVRGVGR